MPTTMTPEVKARLERTVRDLRERLLPALHDSVESAYLLSMPLAKAGLAEAPRVKRQRLEAWVDERARALPAKEQAQARERFRREAEKEAAYTLLHRLVFLRQLEAAELSRPVVVTGGWKSQGYQEFRAYSPDLMDDGTEGYATLLELLFNELAYDLPGLYGDVGVTRLVPVPPATLRLVVEALDDEALTSAWGDDTTLGWVYQFWNDPEREALDAKIADGGKLEAHEIASKTQMFTERYMVEWLLHNSLGVMWLAMCRKHGWTPEAQAVLPALDAKRAEWRRKREAGEVPLDALMPVEPGLEEQWKYYVPQPLPQALVDAALPSVRELKLLDPACGSGHFLVIAFDLLAALYREEARHRGEDWTDRRIAESIIENNLHGVDIDPRPIQLAAAGLYLKAKALSREARPARMNLVASNLQLASLPENDPALVRLCREVKAETGLPEALTRQLVGALKGADHLGTLLKVDAAVEEALRVHERGVVAARQGSLLDGWKPKEEAAPVSAESKATVLEKLESFLAHHAGEEDLGLRLDGEQLAAGIRFVRTVKAGSYDIVVGNPPYQGTSRMKDAKYVKAHYPRGKTDLYAAFLQRALELVRPGGASALLTMRGWMFQIQYSSLRDHLLDNFNLRILADLDRGAFSSVQDEVLAASMSIFWRTPATEDSCAAMQPTPLSDRARDSGRTDRKRAAVLAQVGRHEFTRQDLDCVELKPVIYWWTQEYRQKYRQTPKLGKESPARFGVTTGDNARFVRLWFEVNSDRTWTDESNDTWKPFVLGGKGREWIEPLREICRWQANGLEAKEKCVFQYGTVSKQIRNEEYYFKKGISFSTIGTDFSARVHRYASIFSNAASTVFPYDVPGTMCMMNSSESRRILACLNPTVHFEIGDVNRLPILKVESSDLIFNRLEQAFGEHEQTREPSVEFKKPGATAWQYAQAWAQRAVDRPNGSPLPLYEPVYDPPQAVQFVSFAVGVALGRFGVNGEGILQRAPDTSLPHGILFLSAATEQDSLAHPACAPLRKAWDDHGAVVSPGDDLRTFLRESFFKYHCHKNLYDNRPIYFPLSSAKRNFVAWVSIHRWHPPGELPTAQNGALQALLADYLLPEKRSLEGELDDLRNARTSPDKKQRAEAEKRYAQIQKLHEELIAFIATVTECAEKGPPPADAKSPSREKDARHIMELDDGVMVNSAALWPLLEPQWKDPRKWWKELASAQGRKGYDWSHLAERYFPDRVESKCREDPSFAIAHKRFWRLHPARAYAWELRLRDELGDDSFKLDEPGSDMLRADFLVQQPLIARQVEEAEHARRERKRRKDAPSDQLELTSSDEETEDTDAEAESA